MGELETGCLCSVRNGDQDISKANPAAAEAFLGNFKIKWRELKNAFSSFVVPIFSFSAQEIRDLI